MMGRRMEVAGPAIKGRSGFCIANRIAIGLGLCYTITNRDDTI